MQGDAWSSPGSAGCRSLHKDRQKQGDGIANAVPLTAGGTPEGKKEWLAGNKGVRPDSTRNKAVGTENLGTSKRIICVLSKLCMKKKCTAMQARDICTNNLATFQHSPAFLFVFHSFSCQTQEKQEKV